MTADTQTRMVTSIHHTLIPDYSAGFRLDLDGYAPLPGARIEDHLFDGVDLDEADADYWREIWWPTVLAHNARELVQAEAMIAAWREISH